VDETAKALERINVGTQLSLGRDRVIDDMCASIQQLTRNMLPLNSWALASESPELLTLLAGTIRARESPRLGRLLCAPRSSAVCITKIILENDSRVATLR